MNGTDTVVDVFGTGFQHTTVTRTADGAYRWIRRAGPDRPTPLRSPSPTARALLTGAGAEAAAAPVDAAAAVRLSLPTPAEDTLTYDTTGPVSVAKLLWRAAPGPLRERMARDLHGTGALLHRMHGCVPVRDTALTQTTGAHSGTPPPSGPSGPARLAAWLDSGRGPRAASRLHRLLRDRLSAAQWDAVRSWCADLARPEPDAALLHGAPSTGSLVVGRDTMLLGGEDLARGPAGFDLGWLLGEFVELRMTATGRGAAVDPLLLELPRALVAGYGTVPDIERTGRAAVLRLLTHAHDFAAYMGWHPELVGYAETAPTLIDTEGRTALDGTD